MIKSICAVVVMMMCCSISFAHPPITFSSVTYDINPAVKVNEEFKLKFVINDLWNHNAPVTFSQLLPMHDRYMHIMLGSPDMEIMYHIHMEDYYDPSTTPNATYFWIPVTLPVAGVWSFAASFIANVTGGPREGSGLFEFQVSGTPAAASTITVDYSTKKKFKTYAIGSNEVFDTPININSNTDPNGYTVSITFGEDQKGSISNLTAYACQTFYFEVTKPDGTPATNLVPFLDASAHVIWQADQDTTYHGHAALLTSQVQTYAKLAQYTKMMSPSGGMMMDMTDQENAMIMEGIMMGINVDGSLNCTSDMARIMKTYGMDYYMPMLPADLTFGPRFIGAFDFPNDGVWRGYFYMQVKEGNETKLIVPDFTIRSTGGTAPTTIPVSSTTSPTDIATSFAFARLSVSLAMVFASFVLAVLF